MAICDHLHLEDHIDLAYVCYNQIFHATFKKGQFLYINNIAVKGFFSCICIDVKDFVRLYVHFKANKYSDNLFRFLYFFVLVQNQLKHPKSWHGLERAGATQV